MGISFQPIIAGAAVSGSDQRPPAIDPRFTFARRHFEQICSKPNLVLPVDEIYDTLTLEGKREEPSLREELLRAFFNLDCPRPPYPDLQVYFPVAVKVSSIEDRHHPRTWHDLTDLILAMRKEKNPAGIILSARSGAGKTVAALKAFFDCLVSPAGGAAPSLAGYLPLWVDLEADRKGLSLAEAIASQLGLPSLPDSWPTYCPPLLLFFDLNAASAEVRSQMAEQIHVFQKRQGQAGHRCVVAYRSTQEDDLTICQLRKDGCFARYDLEPLSLDTALKYVRHIRNFEDKILIAQGLACRERNIEADDQRLREFIHRHAHGGSSLISTPLLMHFCSMLSPKEMAKTTTVAALYEQVVDKLLHRNRANYPARLQDIPGPEDSIRVAMCRVALVMLADGARHPDQEESTRISEERLEGVLRNPEDGKPGTGGRPWWPTDRFWPLNSRYFKDRLGVARSRKKREREFEALLELSLLRKDGERFGFLHDSFLYYFAAAALRYHKGPGSPGRKDSLHPKWPIKTAERMRESTESWILPAEFLGGMLDLEPATARDGKPEQARALAGAIISADPAPGMPAVLLQLLRGMGERAARDEILGPVLRFVDREQHRLATDPERLYQELYNELTVTSSDKARQWLCDKVTRPKRPETTLLRVRLKSSSPEDEGLAQEAVFSPDGTCVLVIMRNGSASLWDAHTGDAGPSLETRGATIQFAAFSSDRQRIVTAGGTRVLLCTRQTGEYLREYRGLTSRALSVRFSSDGTRIIVDAADRQTREWETDTARLIDVTRDRNPDVMHTRATEVVEWGEDPVHIKERFFWIEKNCSAGSVDGKLVATVWRVVGGNCEVRLQEQMTSRDLGRAWIASTGRSAKWSEDGVHLVVITTNGDIYLWRVEATELPVCENNPINAGEGDEYYKDAMNAVDYIDIDEASKAFSHYRSRGDAARLSELLQSAHQKASGMLMDVEEGKVGIQSLEEATGIVNDALKLLDLVKHYHSPAWPNALPAPYDATIRQARCLRADLMVEEARSFAPQCTQAGKVAQSLFDEAIAVYRDLDDRVRFASALLHKVSWLVYGHPDCQGVIDDRLDIARFFKQAFDLCNRIGYQEGTIEVTNEMLKRACTLLVRAALWVDRDRVVMAIKHAEYCMQLAKKVVADSDAVTELEEAISAARSRRYSGPG